MKKKLLSLLLATSLTVLSGCATIAEYASTAGKVASVALDRANTVSNAFALRDGYLTVKEQVVANSELFTTEELVELESHATIMESFAKTVLELAQSGNGNDMLVNADEFLQAVLIVRESVNRSIAIVEPKLELMGTSALITGTNAFSSYQKLSGKLDALLAKNDRKEAVLLAANFLRAAVPVIQSLRVL